MSVPTATAKPPGKGWYAVAAVLVLAAVAANALFIFTRIGGIGAGLQQVVVPGAAALQLDKAGDYTIFHEYRSVVDGKIYESMSISGLSVTVMAPDGANVPLIAPAASGRYSLSARSGISVFTFTAAVPGSYRLAAAYADGRREPQTVLAVGSGFLGSILMTVFGALLIMFAGVGGGVVLGVVVYLRRRRARLAGVSL